MTSKIETNVKPIKIVLIGDCGVGKSAIFQRFTEGRFPSEDSSTQTNDFKLMDYELSGNTVRLQVWDTVGQEKFSSLTSSYYQGADGVICVLDLSDRRTFETLVHWYADIQKHTRTTNKLLVGNKVDLDPEVKTEEAAESADKAGFRYLEVSAKTGVHIQEAFAMIISQITGTEYPPKAGASNEKTTKGKSSTFMSATPTTGRKPTKASTAVVVRPKRRPCLIS